MAEKRRIRPGQVPDWRPGAVYWKPLADGREVTIYPLLGGKARLCVGPLADPHGYDIAYRYPDVNSAEEAARAWDGESREHPGLYEEIESAPRKHPVTGKLQVHSGALMVNTKLELTDELMMKASVTERRGATPNPDLTTYDIELRTEDGRLAQIEAIRRVGDPMGNAGGPIVTIAAVKLHGSVPPGATSPGPEDHQTIYDKGMFPPPWSKGN